MSDLTGKFTDLETQLAANQSDLIAGMGALNDSLLLIVSALDTLNNNGATNTKYLLSAINASDPCVDCGSVSPIVPGIGSATPPADTDTCQRVQAFIATIAAFAAGYTTLQSYNVTATVSVINSTIQTVISGISGTDEVPLPSFPETVNLVGDYFSSAASHIFDSTTPSDSFALVSSAMRDALFSAGSTPGMQSAFNSIIESSGMPAADKLLLKATAYNALWAYFFDPASEPDLSGYDGELCSLPVGTCYELAFVPALWSNGGNDPVVSATFGPFTPVDAITSSSGVVTSDVPCFYAGDLTGWTWEVLTGEVHITYRTAGLGSSDLFSDTSVAGVTGSVLTAPNPTGSFFIRGTTGSSVRLCYAG